MYLCIYLYTVYRAIYLSVLLKNFTFVKKFDYRVYVYVYYKCLLYILFCFLCLDCCLRVALPRVVLYSAVVQKKKRKKNVVTSGATGSAGRGGKNNHKQNDPSPVCVRADRGRSLETWTYRFTPLHRVPSAFWPLSCHGDSRGLPLPRARRLLLRRRSPQSFSLTCITIILL